MSNAYELGLQKMTGIANEDLSSYQYYAIKMNTSEKIILASDAGDEMLGVLQDEPAAADRACEIAFGGITKAVGGEAIEEGAKVGVGAGGKFVTYTTGGVAGYAVTPCGGDGQQFSLLIVKST
jgi:hypothetical protein